MNIRKLGRYIVQFTSSNRQARRRAESLARRKKKPHTRNKPKNRAAAKIRRKQAWRSKR